MAGQLIARGKNVWLVRIFPGRDENGKQKFLHKTIHGAKRDAETWAAEQLRDRDLGASLQSKTTVDGLLEALKLDYKINGKDYA